MKIITSRLHKAKLLQNFIDLLRLSRLAFFMKNSSKAVHRSLIAFDGLGSLLYKIKYEFHIARHGRREL